MRTPGRRLPPTLALLVALAAAPGYAQDAEECPNPVWPRLQLSQEDLQERLRAHQEWLDNRGWANPTISGRAVLCNAGLHKAQLQGANLSRAWLQGAILSQAQLQGANLSQAQLQGANLWKAQLQDADLTRARLHRAILRRAQLQGANLDRAELQDANLIQALLHRAILTGTLLQRAALFGAQLDRADLRDADLSGANLREAELRRTKLHATNLENAKLSRAILFGAEYEAAAAPARGHLTDLQGLYTVRPRPGQGSGLAQLRTQLAGAGLRDLEREATYALERQITRHKLQAWREQPLSSLGVGLESAFRRVAFDWPVAYGLYPGRALRILLGLILVFSVPYMVALINPLTRHAGIWRVWAADRVVKLREQDEPERLEDDWYGDPWWRALYRVPLGALQFSILSAFHIGFREINVGSWIARVQAQEYTLRATGWVRVVAGLQSLLSIYLIAIWALTYFGRPFQ